MISVQRRHPVIESMNGLTEADGMSENGDAMEPVCTDDIIAALETEEEEPWERAQKNSDGLAREDSFSSLSATEIQFLDGSTGSGVLRSVLDDGDQEDDPWTAEFNDRALEKIIETALRPSPTRCKSPSLRKLEASIYYGDDQPVPLIIGAPLTKQKVKSTTMPSPAADPVASPSVEKPKMKKNLTKIFDFTPTKDEVDGDDSTELDVLMSPISSLASSNKEWGSPVVSSPRRLVRASGKESRWRPSDMTSKVSPAAGETTDQILTSLETRSVQEEKWDEHLETPQFSSPRKPQTPALELALSPPPFVLGDETISPEKSPVSIVKVEKESVRLDKSQYEDVWDDDIKGSPVILSPRNKLRSASRETRRKPASPAPDNMSPLVSPAGSRNYFPRAPMLDTFRVSSAAEPEKDDFEKGSPVLISPQKTHDSRPSRASRGSKWNLSPPLELDEISSSPQSSPAKVEGIPSKISGLESLPCKDDFDDSPAATAKSISSTAPNVGKLPVKEESNENGVVTMNTKRKAGSSDRYLASLTKSQRKLMAEKDILTGPPSDRKRNTTRIAVRIRPTARNWQHSLDESDRFMGRSSSTSRKKDQSLSGIDTSMQTLADIGENSCSRLSVCSFSSSSTLGDAAIPPPEVTTTCQKKRVAMSSKRSNPNWQDALGKSDRYLGLASSTSRKKELLHASPNKRSSLRVIRQAEEHSIDSESEKERLPTSPNKRQDMRSLLKAQRNCYSERYLGRVNSSPSKRSSLQIIRQGDECSTSNENSGRKTPTKRPDMRSLFKKKSSSERYLGLAFPTRRPRVDHGDDCSVRSNRSGASSTVHSGRYLGLGFGVQDAGRRRSRMRKSQSLRNIGTSSGNKPMIVDVLRSSAAAADLVPRRRGGLEASNDGAPTMPARRLTQDRLFAAAALADQLADTRPKVPVRSRSPHHPSRHELSFS